MTCQACALTLEAAIRKVPGVAHVEVNFAARTATIAHDSPDAPRNAVAAAVRAAGYEVPDGADHRTLREDVEFADDAEHRALVRTRWNAAIAGIFCIATIAALVAGAPPTASLALSIPVVWIAGLDLMRSGARAAVRRAPDMNTLVALGALTAWIAAAVDTLAPGALPGGRHHLHAAVLIVFFVLVGRWMEGRSRSRAGDALRSLLELAPDTARVFRRGEELVVALSEVRPGNLVLVRPGERIPVDGTVVEGESSVDNALFTGESFPVPVRAPEAVFAGALNVDGALSVRASGVGEATALGRIAERVRAAQNSRAPIQRLVDRISAVFVPFVLAAALTTMLAWSAAGAPYSTAIGYAVAVLVIACPCALGLATPTAILVASGRAAREGLLVKNAEALERMASVDTMVLDKTGTLTEGKPRLASVELRERTEDQVLRWAGAAEQSSEQPLGVALTAAARERGIDLPRCDDFRALPGRGVHAIVEGRDVWVGSPNAARELTRSGEDAQNLEQLVRPLLERGETPVALLVDRVPYAAFGLLDTPREGTTQALDALEQLGLECVIFSGDHSKAVERFAREVGNPQARGELLPEDKERGVIELRERGHVVAMVGDGINDALALERADVGIAVRGGADVALEAADCALLRPTPDRLPVLVALARHTRSTIRSNLLWASLYNIVALPLAAGVLVPWTGWAIPSGVGAAAMAGSSLGVVLNSLRLVSRRLAP